MDTAGHSEVLKKQKTADAPVQVHVRITPQTSSCTELEPGPRTEPKRAHGENLRVL